MAGIGLYIQLLSKQSDKVVAAASVAAQRDPAGRFSSADVTAVFNDLRVPAPSGVTAHLSKLSTAGLVIRDIQSKRWDFTPLGRQRAAGVLGEHATAAAQAVAVERSGGGAEIAEAVHPVIPPSFAPPRWREGINRLLDRFPFETNVFCMTRFPDDDGELPDPVVGAIAVIRETCAQHGLTLHLASDRIVEEELFGNVGAYMWACKYGIGLLENRVGRGLNYNVTIELGAMLVTGRRCAILKDISIDGVPTDIAGHIYKSVNLDASGEVERSTSGWIVNDLGL